ncbi:MAG: PsbP-related protein, partial [Chloroflexota bacterium]
MRNKFAVIMFMFGVVALVFPSAIFAQAATLSETFTAPDKSFTVKYPAGWSVTAIPEDPNDVRFFPSDGSANSLAVQISETDAKTLEDAIKPTQRTMNNMTEVPTVIESNGRQMLYVEGTPYDNLIAGVLFDNGKIAYVIGYTESADKSQWKQVVLDEAASIDMAGANPAGGSAVPAEATTAEATTAAPAAASDLHPTQLWSVQTKSQYTSGVAYSPDDKYVASIGSVVARDNADIILLDAATGKVVQTYSGHEPTVTAITFSPDSQTLASASTDGTVRLWDVATGKEKLNLKQFAISNLAFSPDGASLAFAVNGDPGTIDLLDIASGTDKVVFSKPSQSFTLHNVAYTPDGTLLFVAADYTTSSDAHTTVWQLDTATQEATSIFDQPGDPLAFIYPASGNPLVVTGKFTGDNFALWDMKSGTKITDLAPAKDKDGNETAIMAANSDPTGTILATSSSFAALELRDAKSGTDLALLDHKPYSSQISSHSLAFSSDGKMLVVG